MVTYAKISPKVVYPRAIAGNTAAAATEEEEEEKRASWLTIWCCRLVTLFMYLRQYSQMYSLFNLGTVQVSATITNIQRTITTLPVGTSPFSLPPDTTVHPSLTLLSLPIKNLLHKDCRSYSATGASRDTDSLRSPHTGLDETDLGHRRPYSEACTTVLLL